jgi:hypothetical protein
VTAGKPQGICMPANADPAKTGCGKEGGPCCVSWRASRFVVTCDNGLACAPPSGFFYRSDAQLAKLSGANFAKGYTDPAVVGRCEKAGQCNKAYGPCGAKECPGVKLACPAGFYCASYADATVGDRCMPLPEIAGKAGYPCLPNNLPEAPVVKFPQWNAPRAPPFCKGEGNVCFTHVGPLNLRQRSFRDIFEPAIAKDTASRIWGTLCVNVKTPCGGVGQACCPGVPENVVTDKALPSYGTAWSGRPCDDTAAGEGAYCDGQWTALGGPLSGKCVANAKGCTEIGNTCCIRTTSDKAEVKIGGGEGAYVIVLMNETPLVSPCASLILVAATFVYSHTLHPTTPPPKRTQRFCTGGGKRVYCVFTDNKCRQCPRVAETLLDFFVCT